MSQNTDLIINSTEIHENRLKLLLELSLCRKVNEIEVKKIEISNKQPDKDEITLDVWLYSYELLKEKNSLINSKSEVHVFKNQPGLFKCKLGSIIFDDLYNSNVLIQDNKENKESKDKHQDMVYYIIFAKISIDSIKCLITDDDPRNKELNYFYDETSGVYYIHGNQLKNNKKYSCYHWLLVKDFSKVYFDSLIKFKLDTNEIKCFNSNCPNLSYSLVDIKYCHNDNKYFCNLCIDEFHKQYYNTLKKHTITPAVSYSITYKFNCKHHELNQIEFYCSICNGLYCVKCFESNQIHGKSDIHSNILGQDKFTNTNVINSIDDTQYIVYLNQIINDYEYNLNSLNNQIKEFLSFIDKEIEQRMSKIREVQKKHKEKILEINMKLNQNKDILENEILKRCTFLASRSVEIQRIVSEIDSKKYFLKQQFANSDQSTYISMLGVFEKYMIEELFVNLDLLLKDSRYEDIQSELYIIEKKEDNKN